MSHISSIKLEINDLNVLKKACKKLGFKFEENQKTYKWYGKYMYDSPLPEGRTIEQLGTCDHAIIVPEAKYDVGIVKSKNGKSYFIEYDFWWQGQLEKYIGKNAARIKQRYVAEKLKAGLIYEKCTITEKEIVKNDSLKYQLRIQI